MVRQRFAVWFLGSCFTLCAACDRSPSEQATATQPEQSTLPEYSIEQFLATTTYSGASFSPDNSKILVFSNESGIFNLYAIPTTGGEAQRLTNSTGDSILSAGYFPTDERTLYLSDEGGNELFHVYVRELDGSSRDLTPGTMLRATPAGWLHDFSRFLVQTNERDPRYMDLYAYDPGTYEREIIFENDDGYDFAGASPDGRQLALVKTLTNADSDIYVHDRDTRTTTLVTAHEGAIVHQPQGFSPDGKLLYLTDRDSEYLYAIARDVDTGEETVLAKDDWDVQFVDYSHGGRYLIVGVNKDARTDLNVIDTRTGQRIALPAITNASIVSAVVSRDERMLALYAESSTMPRDLFVQALRDAEGIAASGTPRQLTHSLGDSLDPAMLVDGTVKRFASFDGLEISGVLYMPHGASPERKVPALVMVHGGPGGQSRIGYNDAVQYLVNHGYAIYAINNRGSSGYGKTFFHLDDQAHGEGDLDDCVASTQMLIDTGLVDPKRIGIFGGSYGGYMVLAALTFRPQAFELGVDLFGISNWHRTVQSIPPWWESARQALSMEMGDFDDEAYFRRISPLFHADAIERPLLVIQGENDPRVLKVESDEIVAAVRKNNVPVKYVVFDDEGHGFVKRENQAVAYRTILEFLDAHLRADGG